MSSGMSVAFEVRAEDAVAAFRDTAGKSPNRVKERKRGREGQRETDKG